MKLPVFQTFSHAFGFAVRNFFTCLRLAWLPVTLLFATQQAVEYYMLGMLGPHMMDVDEHRPLTVFRKLFEMWDRIAIIQVSMLLLQGLVIAAIAVSFHRIILFGDRRSGSIVNFAFGRTEFLYMLMAASMGLFTIAILGVVLVPAILVVTGGHVQDWFTQLVNITDKMDDSAALMMLRQFGTLGFAYFVALLLAAYVLIRLAVWPPSVVATGRLGPSEPWSLTRGNILRFIGMFILTGMVIWILLAALALSVFAGGGFEAIKGLQSLDHQDPIELRRHMYETMQPWLPVIYIGILFAYTFFTSLVVGLISYSYKALKGYDANEPVPA
jgi:hypothetical protein